MTKHSPITNKQYEIIQLLYRYRFLNRNQIQLFLGHKDKRRIISWLKDLRDNQYIDWHYDPTDFIAKSQPAIYFLALGGIRLLRERGGYSGEELRKRYRDKDRTQGYIDQCQLAADCCLALQAKSSGSLRYEWALPADIIGPGGSFGFLAELKPHLYFTKYHGDTTTSYVMEVIESTLPHYQLRKRIKDYISLLSYDLDDEQSPAPIALFACPDTATLIYIKRRIRQVLAQEDGTGLTLRVTTRDKLAANGLTGMIWEEV